MTETFHCPFCAHENPLRARFCNECGSPLHLAPCAHCDAVNDIELRECYSCGAPLPRAPQDAELPFADEPSHSISSDIDIEALDAMPSRDPRRKVLPAALVAIMLLVAAGTVVGYVAYRQGVLPYWTAAPTVAAAPAAASVAAAPDEAAKDPESTAAEPAQTPPTAAPDTPVPAPATAVTETTTAAPTMAAAPVAPPRRPPVTKAEPAIDKDAAATQSLIQREISGFGPPKPLPPRAPPESP